MKRTAPLLLLSFCLTCAYQQRGAMTSTQTNDLQLLLSSCSRVPDRDIVDQRIQAAKRFSGELSRSQARQLIRSSVQWLEYFEHRDWNVSTTDWGCPDRSTSKDEGLLSISFRTCEPRAEVLSAVRESNSLVARHPSFRDLRVPLVEFVERRSPRYNNADCGRARTQDEEVIRGLLTYLFMLSSEPPPSVEFQNVNPDCVAIPTIYGKLQVSSEPQVIEPYCGGNAVFFAGPYDPENSADCPRWICQHVEGYDESYRALRIMEVVIGGAHMGFVMGQQQPIDEWVLVDEIRLGIVDCINPRRG